MESRMFNSEQWEGTARELVLVVHPRRKLDAKTNSERAFRVLGRLLEARKQCRVYFHQVPHFSGLGTQEMWAGLAEVQVCVCVP